MDETPKEQREPEVLYNLLQSEGWQLAMGIFEEKAKHIDSISTLDENLDFARLGQATAARMGALAIIRDWFSDLEARAGNFASLVADVDEDHKRYL